MLSSLSFQNQVNAVGGLAFLIVAGYAAAQLTTSRDSAACGTRFNSSIQMPYQRSNGAPLTPAELQARVGFGDRGLLDKASVQSVTGAPSPYVLDVAVGGPQDTDSGISFFWKPKGIANATTACLSYSVFIPTDFEFVYGGRLPGLYGEMGGAGAAGSQQAFSAHMIWADRGNVGVDASLSQIATGTQAGQTTSFVPDSVNLPRGRWVNIDQEITLNTPNAQNGTLRFWVDGRLKMDNPNLAWRSHASVRFSGALVDVGYTQPQAATDKKPTRIKLSPMRLAWE